MAAHRKPHVTVDRITDVGEWGEKDQRGAYDGPLNIAGDQVDLEKCPPLSGNDQAGRPVPLAPAGTP